MAGASVISAFLLASRAAFYTFGWIKGWVNEQVVGQIHVSQKLETEQDTLNVWETNWLLETGPGDAAMTDCDGDWKGERRGHHHNTASAAKRRKTKER